MPTLFIPPRSLLVHKSAVLHAHWSGSMGAWPTPREISVLTDLPVIPCQDHQLEKSSIGYTVQSTSNPTPRYALLHDHTLIKPTSCFVAGHHTLHDHTLHHHTLLQVTILCTTILWLNQLRFVAGHHILWLNQPRALLQVTELCTTILCCRSPYSARPYSD
jgi:hypothetical protein